MDSIFITNKTVPHVQLFCPSLQWLSLFKQSVTCLLFCFQHVIRISFWFQCAI